MQQIEEPFMLLHQIPICHRQQSSDFKSGRSPGTAAQRGGAIEPRSTSLRGRAFTRQARDATKEDGEVAADSGSAIPGRRPHSLETAGRSRRPQGMARGSRMNNEAVSASSSEDDGDEGSSGSDDDNDNESKSSSSSSGASDSSGSAMIGANSLDDQKSLMMRGMMMHADDRLNLIDSYEMTYEKQ